MTENITKKKTLIIEPSTSSSPIPSINTSTTTATNSTQISIDNKENFEDVKKISDKKEGIIFVLWGANAFEKESLIRSN